MEWKQGAPNVIDLSGQDALPARIDLIAQGKDEEGEFERRQCAHYLKETSSSVPVRNAKGEIEAVTTVTRGYTGEGLVLDEEGKTLTLPARLGWPDKPFSMVKAIAVAKDGTETVLFEKVPAE